jgi:hypothetical protein
MLPTVMILQAFVDHDVGLARSPPKWNGRDFVWLCT